MTWIPVPAYARSKPAGMTMYGMTRWDFLFFHSEYTFDMKPLSTLIIDPRSTDGLQLSGLLFSAESSNIHKSAVIYLHWNGSKGIFYAHKWNSVVSEVFGLEGIAYCTFNNRGGTLINHLDTYDQNGNCIDQKNSGVWYEKIEDCVYDIDGVVEYLRNLWYERFFLMGKSTGANKICVYHDILKKQGRKTPLSGYILLSWGDDVGLWHEDMGIELFQEVLSNAQKAIQKNRGGERPVIRRCFLEDFSYQSAEDILGPDGPYNCFPFFEAFQERLGTKKLFEAFSWLDIPTLVIYGENDEYVRFPMDEVIKVLQSCNSNAQYQTISGADHWFEGYEKILAERIVSWLHSVEKN